ncbi:MAG: hypothetical protein LBB65_03750 [Burkholderiales bacterium]|nr:hypothetical protein [Burkholderiales bacterium]
MRKNLFICLFLSLLLAGCGGSGSGSGGDSGGSGGGYEAKKLLSRIVIEGTAGSGERTFQYDDRNRLIADSYLGDGNKIEYQDDDSRPSLVTLGTPYPIATQCYDLDILFVYSQYRYGENDLSGVPTKYYQKQSLDQNKNPLCPTWSDTWSLPQYLNSNDRVIDPSSVYPNIYDDKGNLLETKMFLSGGHFSRPFVYVWKYTYDDKKNPASAMASPQWWFVNSIVDADYSGQFLINTNNPLSLTVTAQANDGTVLDSYSASTIFHYTYDQDGYPTAVDVTTTTHDQGVEQTSAYRETFEYIPAH